MEDAISDVMSDTEPNWHSEDDRDDEDFVPGRRKSSERAPRSGKNTPGLAVKKGEGGTEKDREPHPARSLLDRVPATSTPYSDPPLVRDVF